MKVLPLRISVEAIRQLDEVWRGREMRSRMDLFRAALHLYLKHLGAREAAALFASG